MKLEELMAGEDSEPAVMLRIGRNTFYDQKIEIPMKIPEFKRSGIGIVMEFSGIPSKFPTQA
jgi:hypothetical protein